MWNYFTPEESTWYRWRLNGAEAWLRKNGDEWRLAAKIARYDGIAPLADGPLATSTMGGATAEGAPSEDLAMTIAVAAGTRVALRPLMPDRPYLIASRSDVRIHGGSEAVFKLDLPVLFRFQLEGGAALREFFPFALSNTWFGDKTAGSLCYSIPTALDPECRGESSEASGAGTRVLPSFARCEIVVRNAGKGELHVERLAVYTDLLRVYARDEHLETDRVIVEGLSDAGLKMSVIPRSPDRRGELLSEARLGQGELLVRRGVNFLKSVAGS